MAKSWDERHLLRESGSFHESSHHVVQVKVRSGRRPLVGEVDDQLLDSQSESGVSRTSISTSDGNGCHHSYGTMLHGTNVSKVTLNEFDHFPVHMACTNCRKEIETKVHHRPGKITWYTCAVLTLVCCCCLPFCLDSFKDAHHVCPSCGHTVGVYRHFDK